MIAGIANIINFADRSVNILVKAPRQTPGRGEFLHMVSEGLASLHAKRKLKSLKSNHQDMWHLNSRKEGFDITEEALHQLVLFSCGFYIAILVQCKRTRTKLKPMKTNPLKVNAFGSLYIPNHEFIFLSQTVLPY